MGSMVGTLVPQRDGEDVASLWVVGLLQELQGAGARYLRARLLLSMARR